MYLEHFGLRDKPFSQIPDPEYLFFSPVHRAAFTMLEYGLLEQTGITVITGEVGSGKTTLLRLLLQRIDYEKLTVGVVNNAHGNFQELLEWMGAAFEVPQEGLSKIGHHQALQRFMVDEFNKGKRVVLIIDEAQNIEPDALEELRLLSNINADKHQLLQLILVGQPELLETLREPGLRQFAQRVSTEFHIQPLNLKETMAYIRHRVRVAGSEETLFEQPAQLAIYYFSGGVPRLINTICDQALALAYGVDAKQVSLALALETVKGKKIGGINPHKNTHPDMEKIRILLEKSLKTELT